MGKLGTEIRAALIPLEKCKDRMVYVVRARNIQFGVFNQGVNGFVGLRTKFGSRFLATEFHDETGAPHGTCFPVQEIEFVPDDLMVLDLLPGTLDWNTKRRIVRDDEAGKWKFEDTGKFCEKASPTAINNDALCNWMKAKEEEYRKKYEEWL